MAAIIEKVKVSSEIIVGIEREEIFSPKTPAELLVAAVEENGEDQSNTVTVVTPRKDHVNYISRRPAAAVEESGEDQSGTVTVVTPRKDHVYHLPSKFIRPVQEINMAVSVELVC